MLTFLSSPKPFQGVDKENQYRAIKSWLATAADVEVILYGSAAGIDEAGYDLQVKVIKDVECSSTGVPFFGRIAHHAAEYGKYNTQVYLNCDILLSGILEAVSKIDFKNFLGIGQRLDLSANTIVEDDPIQYKQTVRKLFAEGKIKFHEATGIDYFIFTRHMWDGLPKVAIGRGGYDNALLDFCKKKHFPIIDCTLSIIALHQFHDYNHVSGKKNFVFQGDEAKQNLAVAGKYSLLSVADADYILEDLTLKQISCRGDYIRGTELNWRYRKGFKFASLMLRAVWRVLYSVRLIKRRDIQLDTLIATGHPVFF